MLYQLTNAECTITISSMGAELKSVKRGSIEYMWQANPEFWGRTSPVLFPIVGRLTNNTTLINKQTYEITQHGFVRDMEFSCIEQSESHLLFLVSSNKKTRPLYPFDFKLYVAYTLVDSELVIEYFVRNVSEEELLVMRKSEQLYLLCFNLFEFLDESSPSS